jgi:U4/U6 small nuclear ribonucleoprotein PRP3
MNIKPITRQPIKLKTMDLIPDVEWWDAYFLPVDKKSFSPYWIKDQEGNFIHNAPEQIKFEDFKIDENDFMKEKVTMYVQHPVQLKNEFIEKQNKVTMPTLLTKKEKKKLRRLRRLEKEKDKQEKMKLGLIKPDPPKLKYSNVMRILGDTAVQDPSQVEKIVRKAYEERYNKMMKENEARKLTKEQKSEKMKKKFERDNKKEVRACLFKVDSLSEKKIKYKIDKNSQQLYLTGLSISNRRNSTQKIPNLIYVEGRPFEIKKFKKFLLRRKKCQ